MRDSLQTVLADIRWCYRRGIRNGDAIARLTRRSRVTVRAVLRALRATGGAR